MQVGNGEMSMRCTLSTLFVTTLFLLLSDAASAQLFGERTLGQSISRRRSNSMSAVGTVDPSRRFVRGQRSAGEVVGVNSAATQSFVGKEQATPGGVVTSSVAGLREQRRRSVNQPRRISKNGRYPERLRIGFNTPTPQKGTEVAVSPKLISIMAQRGIQIEVSAATHSAILRGVVPSEHDREIAELLVLFEPGIEKVENELTIR